MRLQKLKEKFSICTYNYFFLFITAVPLVAAGWDPEPAVLSVREKKVHIEKKSSIIN